MTCASQYNMLIQDFKWLMCVGRTVRLGDFFNVYHLANIFTMY